MSQALDGLLVVSIDQAVAAPFAASRLADAGARVIKVERHGGDFARDYDSVAQGQSAFFVWLNRGKESIEVDIKSPADVALLRRMLAQADVFIQNLAPGAAARAGLDAASLREANPRLITCSISGYGEDGPYADMKAYDLLVQAETGLASITGTADAPGRVGVSICDIASGMYAYTAILEALVERDRTGEGCALEVSMFDAMADWMTVPLLFEELGNGAPARTGMHHAIIAPYGAFAVGDGTEIVLAIQNQREWHSFCEHVMRVPSLAIDARFDSNETRGANRPELAALIEQEFSTLTRDEVVERLRKANVAYGALNTVADLSAHPQLRRQRVSTPRGEVSLVNSPIRRRPNPHSLGAVPALGQHSADIRKEFEQ
ncbi:MAG: itaconate CoA-transferase [Gammaproteobacteria bacterium]